MSFGLSHENIEKIREIFACHSEVKRAILYGSRAMGTHRDASDIDLTLTGKDLNFKILASIETELDDLLLPFQFDLSIRRQIQNESLLNHIERVGLVFYEREPDSTGECPADALKEVWEVKRLGEVCEIKNGRNQKEVISEAGQYPIYGSAGNLMGMAKNYICDAGTTIIGRKGNINNPVFIQEPFWNVDTAFGLSPLEKIKPRWLFYFCEMYDFASHNRGTTIPSLVKSEIREIPIPLPPLPEQERIVGILDEAFAGIAAAKQRTEKNLQNARALFESHLNAVFTQRGEGWEEKTLDKISKNLDSRRVPITKNVRSSGEYPYYGASGIVDYVADYIFEGDNLLVSEDGANLLARSTPIAFSVSGKYWVNNHAHILNFESMATQRFVEFYLESIKLDDYITGAAQPKLNQKALNSIPIPVPKSVDDQAKIVDGLELLQDETRRLESIYRRKLEALEALKKSLLHQAFAGAL